MTLLQAESGCHLQYALLDVFSSIDDISQYEDAADDHVGDQGGVTHVLKVNIGVGVAQFEASCGKEKIAAVISMSKIENYFHIFFLFVLKLFFDQSCVCREREKRVSIINMIKIYQLQCRLILA